MEPNWANVYDIGEIFFVVIGLILKDNLAIWSHCFQLKLRRVRPSTTYILRQSIRSVETETSIGKIIQDVFEARWKQQLLVNVRIFQRKVVIIFDVFFRQFLEQKWQQQLNNSDLQQGLFTKKIEEIF